VTDAESFYSVVRSRRMVRNYEDRPVPADAVERIVDAARRAPSAGFSQGQSFVVVTDKELRTEIARLAHEPEYVAEGFDPWISIAPVHIVVCTSEAIYRERYAAPDKSPDGTVQPWPVPYWWVDAGASMMTVLLAAVAEGLAAGFLGSHSLGDIKSLLGIPDHIDPIGIVTLGHPAPDRRSGSLDRGWKDTSDVIHHNRWND
jgi:nitroreductase